MWHMGLVALWRVGSFQTKARTHVLCIGRRIVNYCITREALSADFSTETLQARREGHDIFKVMKGKNPQPRILYHTRLSFRFDGEIKSFIDKQKLKEFSTTKPALQEVLK